MEALSAISRHNSAEDAEDVKAWNAFVETVRALAERPVYARLHIDITGGDIPVPPYA